jgi:hypothetical protein
MGFCAALRDDGVHQRKLIRGILVHHKNLAVAGGGEKEIVNTRPAQSLFSPQLFRSGDALMVLRVSVTRAC